MHEKMVPPMTHAQYRDWAQLRIDALNRALKGIPQERSRYHICWGSWNGPHAFDVPMKDIVDLMLQVNVGAYQFEAANPRHEHEWVVWRSVKLPPGKVLIPGVISHATNIVEHPELVAQRAARRDRRARERHGRHRLRLRPEPVCAAGSSHHHVGQAALARRRREDRNAGALGPPLGGMSRAGVRGGPVCM